MAANPLNPKKRMISKSFHRILDASNRQVGSCHNAQICSLLGAACDCTAKLSLRCWDAYCFVMWC
jgi:hypothetical protein